MKKSIFLVMLMVMTCSLMGQVDTNNYTLAANNVDAKYSLVTNDAYSWGVQAGEKMMKLLYAINGPIDSLGWKLRANNNNSKYDKAQNTGYYWGRDSSEINAELVYILNGGGISTSTAHTWTGIQHFDSIFVNIMYLNKIDSVKSTYWYRPDKSVFGFIDPSIDSVYFPKMYVKDLSGQTIVTSTSITSNKIYSDSIIGHSPIFLMADSVIAQNKLLVPYIAMNTAGNFISRFAIGMTDSTGAFNIVRTDKNLNRTTLSQATDTSSFNFRFTPTGKPVFSIKDNLGAEMFGVDSAGRLRSYKLIVNTNDFIVDNSNDYGQFGLSVFRPYSNKYTTLGSTTLYWKGIYTGSLTLGIDSIGGSTSDTIYQKRNTMIVNCDNTNNDTVYLANIGINDGFECTVKKVDANATYVVVKPKGSLTIDGATEDKFNIQWASKTYIYKNKSWYIK